MIRGKLIVLLLCASAIATRPAAAQQHPNIEKGFKPDHVYSVNDVDVVNLFNGNLNVSIPIGGTYSVGGALSYSFTMAYAGNNWDYEELETQVATGLLPPQSPYEWGMIRWAVPFKPLNGGMGWLFSLGRLIQTSISRGNERVYQSPDGSEHPLGSGDGVTADGTYIRQTAVRVNGNIQSYKLEFPDGTIKEFSLDGRLLKILDRFGNAVTVTYFANAQAATAAGVPAPGVACGTTYLAWKVADPHRTHYIYFLPSSSSYTPFFEERICQASLAAFGATRANYVFTYTDRVISRQKVISREAYDPAIRPSPALAVPLLTRIELPYGAMYEMVYDAGMYSAEGATPVGVTSDSTNVPNQLSDLKSNLNPGGASGHLVALRVPTKGGYEWKYQRFSFPPAFGEPYEWDVDPAERWHPTASAGVSERKKYVTATPDTWTYHTSFLNDFATRSVAVTRVDAPDGSSTESYFSIFRQTFEHERDFDYGAPYTRRPEAENPYKGMYISSRTTVPGTTARRRTYVTYEWDPSPYPKELVVNRRLKSRLTVFEDGSETSEVYSDFDGLGHYRTTTIEGTAGPVKRVTWKNYNPTVPPNGLRTITPTAEWLAETYDAVETKDLDPAGVILSQSRTEFCFDSLTGRLARIRSLRGVTPSTIDVLAVFKDENASGGSIDGNVSQEEYYGGDANPLPASFSTCTASLSSLTPRYRLKHGYGFGSRLSTQYDATQSDTMNFKVLDLTIDASSGLPSSTRDVAGVGTTLTYDLLGRLTRVAPVNSAERRATSEYVYTNATDTAGPSVTALQKCPSGAQGCVESQLPDVRYYYDPFGRLVQQRASMGAAGTSPWAASVITYDSVGRKKSSSVAMGVTSGSFAAITPPVTEWKYDILGRTTEIKQPDQSTVKFAYPSSNAVARTAKITTATGAADVTTTETSDALGRLIQVTEDSTGAAVQTRYSYDSGDRLTKVTAGVQTRTFDFDGAGLLRMEDHPENEPTTYKYDARGHVIKKVTDGSTLMFDYDSAERLTTVRHDADGDGTAAAQSLMKEFTFGTSGSLLGRLYTAKRHTYNPWFGGNGIATVTETFAYDAGGRQSSKTTVVDLPGSSRSFTDAYTYDDLGAIKTIAYPECTNCGSTFPRSIENFYEHGYLKGVNGYASEMRYHPNGMIRTVRHLNANGSNGPLDTQDVAATGMNRPLSIAYSEFCNNLSVGTLESKAVTSGSMTNLTATASGGTSFQWWEVSGGMSTAVPGQTTATLNIPIASTREFWVRVGNGSCTIDSNVARLTVTTCGATLSTSNSSPIAQGQSKTITVTLTGTGLRSGTWSDGVTWSSSANSFTRLVTPVGTTSYSLSGSDPNGCTFTSNALEVTVIPPTPILFAATALSGSAVQLAWSLPVGGSVDSYEIERRSGTRFVAEATTTTTSIVRPAAGGTAYLYRVRGVKSGTPSGWAVDLATTVLFTDMPTATTTPIKAEHIVQLRTAVNAVRLLGGLTPAVYTDPTLTGTWPKTVHVLELRDGLNVARTALAIGIWPFTDTNPAPGMFFKAVHVTELRGGVQ